MDKEIAQFMLLAAKLEFFLVNLDQTFAHVHGATGVVRGVNWERVGESLQSKHPFASFDFAGSGFQIFKDTTPQHLVVKEGGGLKWDSDMIEISS